MIRFGWRGLALRRKSMRESALKEFMPAEPKSDFHREIAHVLFIDVVGYSKMLIDEQSEALQALNEIVRKTEPFRVSEKTGKLIRIPAGDGMALLFFNSPEAPVDCALEISKAVRAHPSLRLRMGVHSGPVDAVRDVNDQLNVAGAGINAAQRVMDCGDAGHILLSKRVAEDLAQYREWRPYLHDLGEVEVKHGARIPIVNLYSDEVGNPELPDKLKRVRATKAAEARASRTRGYLRPLLVLLAVALPIIVVLVYDYTRHATAVALGKSIAVLPFENLSEDKANAYFADGIQDEILARLSKIADLKVISRTSTQKYKSAPNNLREIAQQLGVANILEGSVQKSGDAVRVNVQLINALNDVHLWAEIYDRKLNDIFAVESEISKTIADTLQARLSGAEREAIAARPTENTTAYQLYLKGRFFWNKRTGDDLKKALDYFNQAVAADPKYALAYAGISDVYILLPNYSTAAPKECYMKAEAAARQALELDDTLAEAHTSLGATLTTRFDFTEGEKEFRRAINLNANYATGHHWYSDSVLAPTGRLEEALTEMKRALEVDPLSPIINGQLAVAYSALGHSEKAIEQFHRTIELEPDFYVAHEWLGGALETKGDYAAAIAEYHKAWQLGSDPTSLAGLAHTYAVSANTSEALKLLDQLKELSKERYVADYTFAIVHLGLGNKDEALRWLEKAYEDGAGSDLQKLKLDQRLAPLHGDPRFEKLVSLIFGSYQNVSPARKPAP
jgi:TolB-like protein/Tfp pilus assembly protein PilF/class 3 adenylate cyclase